MVKKVRNALYIVIILINNPSCRNFKNLKMRYSFFNRYTSTIFMIFFVAFVIKSIDILAFKINIVKCEIDSLTFV